MFEKFDTPARRAMGLARQEAQRLGSEYIGTEHILAGILIEGEGNGAKVLRDLSVDLKRVRQGIEKLLTPVAVGPIQLGQMPFSPRSKKAMELAAGLVDRLGLPTIGTEHLLLGMMEETESIACQVLRNLGVGIEQVRGRFLARTGHIDPAWSPQFQAITIRAREEAVRRRHHAVQPEHLFWALLLEPGPASDLLRRKGITSEEIENLFSSPPEFP